MSPPMAPRKPASTPDTDPAPGFSEMPQTPFEGMPLKGSFSDWLKDVSDDVAKPSPSESRVVEETIVKPGKRRAKAEPTTRKSSRGGSLGGSTDP